MAADQIPNLSCLSLDHLTESIDVKRDRDMWDASRERTSRLGISREGEILAERERNNVITRLEEFLLNYGNGVADNEYQLRMQQLALELQLECVTDRSSPVMGRNLLAINSVAMEIDADTFPEKVQAFLSAHKQAWAALAQSERGALLSCRVCV